MDEYIKFQNQTAGRDKLFRLVQYTSRIVWSSLERRNSNSGLLEKAKKIDEFLGLMRRMLRFGRFFETLHSALPMISSTFSDSVVRFTIAMSRIANGCFMFLDHGVCLDKLGLLPSKLIDSARWDKLSSKFWLYAIVLGLIRDIHEILKIWREEYANKWRLLNYNCSSKMTRSMSDHLIETEQVQKSTEKTLKRKKNGVLNGIRVVGKIVADHADVAVDTTKNTCDLFIPLNSLGFVKLSPRTIGLLGVISTILSAIPQINPMVKMVPGA